MSYQLLVVTRILNFCGNHSTIEAMPLAPFALVIFQIGSHAFAWAGLRPWSSYFCLPGS
jgi:hypothetical protein